MAYPPIDPFMPGFSVWLTDIYWEISGNPDGKPALYLHGGRAAVSARAAIAVTSIRKNIASCASTGVDAAAAAPSPPMLGELHRNTTLSLTEAVRTHLGIETWLVSGVSWGTTLSSPSGQGLGAGTGRGNDD
jgi:proline iminopeptidase